MVLTELMHNHICETVNVLTGLMYTMYICNNMYTHVHVHGTNTISDTEIGKGVAPGYRQLSRHSVCEREREGESEREGAERGDSQWHSTCFVSHMQGKSTDGCEWSMGSLGSRPSPYVRVLIARGWANRSSGKAWDYLSREA